MKQTVMVSAMGVLLICQVGQVRPTERPAGAFLPLRATDTTTTAESEAPSHGAGAPPGPENPQELASEINRYFNVRACTVVTPDLPRASGQPLALDIQMKGSTYTLDLRPHSVRGDNHVLYEALADGSLVSVDPGPVRTLRGTVVQDRGSTVAASLLDNGLYAMIQFADGERYWMEPLFGRVKGAPPGSHVVYGDNDLLGCEGKCGTPDRPDNGLADEIPEAGGGNEERGFTFCITQLALEADFPYYDSYGSISATNGRMESVINAMNWQYEWEAGITHVISAVVVRTTAASDPYTTTDPFDLVCQLGNEWDNNLSVVPRDVVQLFTGRNMDGSNIGRAATFGGICDSTSCGFFPCDGCGDFSGEASGHYCYVQSDFNVDFSCATDLSAHELGHLWNAVHCSCTDCTMHPYIQCANTFCGPNSMSDIAAFRDSLSCLDCTTDTPQCGSSNAGTCYAANASPNCDDTDCCTQICAADSYCCSTRWDNTCAGEALLDCANCGNPGAGSCFSSNGSPGCKDYDCCAIICNVDDYCCDNSWDGLCADRALEFCGRSCTDCFQCNDGNVCTKTLCDTGQNTCEPVCQIMFADANDNGIVNIADVLACNAAISAGICSMPTCDVSPSCSGNGTLNTADVLAINGAIGQPDPCACPPRDCP